MSSVFDRYGIKEVADVYLYQINPDGTKGAAVLKLDTLKVSTIEVTADNVAAQGGKGNARLIEWDFNKEITLTMEDALFSPKSQAIMLGDGRVRTDAVNISKTLQFIAESAGAAGVPTTWTDVGGGVHDIVDGIIVDEFENPVTEAEIVQGQTYLITFEFAAVNPSTIEISANSFPGTYWIEGDTYARNEITGRDEMYQFIIPRAKMQAENTITMEAEGDPSIFNLNFSVLRPRDGVMIRLTKYGLPEAVTTP